MKSAITALLLALMCATTHAKSYPVLHCVNDRATSAECRTDVKAVVEAMKFWFEPYVTGYNEERSGNGRRQLLDCTRFCEPSITYFTVHAPCDCSSWRRGLLKSPTTSNNDKTELHRSRHVLSDLSALEGPIQIFETYTASITDVKCKEVFLGSKCAMNFVNEYSNEIRVNEIIDEDIEEDGMSQDKQNSLVKTPPPESIHFDPVTGAVIEDPVADDSEDQSLLSDLHPNPDTGDPLTGEEETNEEYDGEKDYGEEEANDSGSFRNPITGKPIDPVTGEDIDDSEEEFGGPKKFLLY